MTDPRARITAGELVVVLSRYELGAIESVSRYRGGSRQSPKVLIVSHRGKFLLKRRAAPSGSSSPVQADRAAFSHAVAAQLTSLGFPIAAMVSDRTGKTVVRVGDHMYELFVFVEGIRYDHQAACATDAGRLLAHFHALLADWAIPGQAPMGTFHNRAQFPERLAAARDRIEDSRARPLIRALGDLYDKAAAEAEALSASRAPEQVIHGDWHPGNMIFRATQTRTESTGTIAAVVDLDSARLGPVIVDVANGALQFAAMRSFATAKAHPADAADPAKHSPPDSSAWRIALDPALFAAFCAGYRKAGPGVLDHAECVRAIPWLMVEALIVEAVLPIAATGSFGRLDPLPLLALVERTAASIITEQDRLVALAGGT